MAFVRVAHRRVLGLRPAPTTPPVPVPGWQVVRRAPEEVLYDVAGGLITPRLLVAKEPGHLAAAGTAAHPSHRRR